MIEPTDRSADGGDTPTDHLFVDTLLAFTLGNLFALLQFSYFFLLEAFLSSRATSFFVALFFWLIGFVIGLNLKSTRLFSWLLAAGISAYYLAWLTIHLFPFDKSFLPVLGGCVSVSGLVPGYYFPFARNRFKRIKYLLFHENNGFLLGTVLSLSAAVFAGKWFLGLAPLAGVVPVILICVYQAWRGVLPVGDAIPCAGVAETALAGRRARNAFPLFAVGLHFGILQIAVFFTIQCYVTATYLGYFAVVLAWMGGVVLNMKSAMPKSLPATLALSAAAYYLFLALVPALGPYHVLLPVAALLVVCVAFPAGAFFRELAPHIAGGSLFFHENNGFVVGYVLSLFAFVKWGVHFLYWAPLLSFAFAVLGQRGDAAYALMLLPIAALLCGAMGNTAAAWLLGFATVLGSVTYSIRPSCAQIEAANSDPPRETTHDQGVWTRLRAWETRAVLFVAGFNLLLLQYFITREFSSILAASELTILIVGASYFAGFSIGYYAARSIPLWVAQLTAIGTFFLHMAVLAFVKFSAGYLIRAGYGLEVMVGLLFLTSFCTSAFYSIFLPKLIEAGGAQSLTSSYTWELIGGGAGVVAMLILVVYAPAFLWPLYFLMLLGLISVLMKENSWRMSFLVIGLSALGLLVRHQQAIMTYSTEDYYQTRGYDHPELLFARNSLYQSVEIIAGYRDPARTAPYVRSAFLNGVEYFSYRYDQRGEFTSETDLSEFTYFLAELPAKYLHRKTGRRLKTLILGAGSMYSLYRVKDYSSTTTMVEIDPVVVQSAKLRWSDVNRYHLVDNYKIVIDDAKHYLRMTDEKFDLIIMDISAPYYLGTNLLHGKEFFTLVRSRLQPNGIFAESTQGRPYPDRPDSMSMKILRAVVDVFPRYRVIDCRKSPRGKRGFVYASRTFDLATGDLVQILKEDGMYAGTATYSEGSPHFRFEKTIPFSLTNMETLLTSNQGRLRRRLALDRRPGDDGRNSAAAVERNREGLRAMQFRLPGALRRQLADSAFWKMVALVLLLAGAARFVPLRRLKR